ncbi:MAG: phosphatase PAP2 family protein [Rickettsiales bacterium]
MHIALRHWLIVPLLFLTACAGGGDKFPYPVQFVDSTQVTPTVLPAPPTAGSKQEKREINGIIARQKAMGPEDEARILEQDHIRPEMILLPVVGIQYTRESYPHLYALMAHAASDAWRIGDNTQDFWNRTRPWLVDSRVKLYAKKITRPSYPSGHTTTNHVWAHLLSELFPVYRVALFERAYDIGMTRSLGGVHYPSDVVAGRQLAGKIYEKMKQNPQFQAELAAARAELSAPIAANDNVPQPMECMASEPGVSMTMCR